MFAGTISLPIEEMDVLSIQEQDRSSPENVLRLNDEAADLIDAGELDEARELIDEALSIAESIGDDEGKAYAYGNLGNYYSTKGYYSEMINELQRPFRELSGTSRGASLGNLIGIGHMYSGEYEAALKVYAAALELAEETDNRRMIAGIRQNMASTYSNLGDAHQSIENYLLSLEMAEEMEDSLTMAVAYENLGYINTDERNEELAERYLTKASEITNAIGNVRYKMSVALNFGVFYRTFDRYDEALASYRQAIELAEEVGNPIVPIQARYNMGNVYQDMGDYEQARTYYEQSLQGSRELGVDQGIMFNYSGLADLHVLTDQHEEAIPLFLNSLELAEKAESRSMSATLMQKLSTAYEAIGDTAQAYSYLKSYMELREEQYETNREEALARQESLLNLRMERENRELAEATMAHQRNVIIAFVLLLIVTALALVGFIWLTRKEKRANRLLAEKKRELEEVNLEKDKILSILSHDLRKPLSQLQGVVFLIREGALNHEDLDQLLKQVDRQLNQGITTLGNYLQWAQSQMEGIKPELKSTDLSGLASSLVDEVADQMGGKSVEFIKELSPDAGALADPDMMKVTLRNLLSNAVKYVDDGGRVTIKTERYGDQTMISVEDNGIGISEDAQKEIFKSFSKTSVGTMGEVGTGLGLAICKDFTEKQNGTISCESVPGEWTRFTISLPASQIRERVTSSVSS
ncbi:MAG: tetratricopeptide repeat protein [Balneolaceae bacterium]|nr:tetratricopeptide repeat protein [Balneolaceae bacterium]